jgi:dsDNA-specific endonuclease/ATPase MutS2
MPGGQEEEAAMPAPEESGDVSGGLEIPIDGVLDLHQFQAREAQALIEDYIDECLRRGIRELRIIHGKGTGALRRSVHATLAHHPAVLDFGHPSDGGSWGATVVRLRDPASSR